MKRHRRGGNAASTPRVRRRQARARNAGWARNGERQIDTVKEQRRLCHDHEAVGQLHVGSRPKRKSFEVVSSSLIADIGRVLQKGYMTLSSSRALFALSLAAAASILSGCFSFSPAEQVIVPLPLDGAVVRIEVWGNASSEGRFEIAVKTSLGSASHVLWEDWGPAQRTSLYLTADRRLVVLGGGGTAEMIAISSRTKPRWVPYAERPKENGDAWQYLGAVDRYVDHLVFYSPSQQKECIPLYGEGTSPYRKLHQSEHFC